jgi:hypothetical protein
MVTSTPEDASSGMIAFKTGTVLQLSKLETVPTELIEHIGSYLTHEITEREIHICDATSVCAVRMAFKTMKAKVDRMFRACLAVKVVSFDTCSLWKLVQLAYSKIYGLSAKLIMITKDEEGRVETLSAEQTENLREIAEMAASSTQLPINQATPVFFMAVAFPSLKNFKSLFVD